MKDEKVCAELTADIHNINAEIRMSMTESVDSFIFTEIKPFCEEVVSHEVSKKELEEMLLRAERMKWIPCSERLPEDGEYVLVSFENDGILLPDIATYEERNGSGGFFPSDRGIPYSMFGMCVNAWMPLPEPYKGE